MPHEILKETENSTESFVNLPCGEPDEVHGSFEFLCKKQFWNNVKRKKRKSPHARQDILTNDSQSSKN